MESESGVEPASANNSRNRIRWWPVPAALGQGVLLQVAATLFFAENLSYWAFASVFIIWPLTTFLLLLWWTFWSRLSWRIRGWGWLTVAAAFGLFVAMFRFEEFDGAMLPRFSWRWSPTAEARAELFFKNRSPASANPASAPPTPDNNDGSLEDRLEPNERDWPEYQGPHRDGVVVGLDLRTDWSTRPPKQLWRQPIGLGWGSFAVVGRRAWTLEQRGPDELVTCYDIVTGRELWTHTDSVRFESVQGGHGPRSTPTFRDGKVFTLGGTGLLNCLDAKTGKRVWGRNILEDAGTENLPWGQSGSPLLVDDLVIVSPGSNDAASKSKNSAAIAYRADNGEKVWSAGNHYGSYASPQLATLNGERQVLIFDGLGLSCRALRDGAERWQFPWTNTPQINASQPLVIDERRILIGAGYGKGSALIDVTVVGSKDSSNAPIPAELWTSSQFKIKFNNAVRRGDYFYGLDEGLLTCIGIKDGKRRWKQGRFGYGQLLLVADKLLVLSEEGDVVLIPAQPELPTELARFHAIDGKSWNNPVIASGLLLLRNSTEAASYDLR